MHFEIKFKKLSSGKRFPILPRVTLNACTEYEMYKNFTFCDKN